MPPKNQLTFLKAQCLRCPMSDASDTCSCTPSKQPSLAKCSAKGSISALWRGFTDDAAFDFAAILKTDQDCRNLYDQVCKTHNKVYGTVEKLSLADATAAMHKWKKEEKFQGVPVTKQMLEHAFDRINAQAAKKVPQQSGSQKTNHPVSHPVNTPTPPAKMVPTNDQTPLLQTQASATVATCTPAQYDAVGTSASAPVDNLDQKCMRCNVHKAGHACLSVYPASSYDVKQFWPGFCDDDTDPASLFTDLGKCTKFLGEMTARDNNCAAQAQIEAGDTRKDPENAQFLSRFRATYDERKVTKRQLEHAYVVVYGDFSDNVEDSMAALTVTEPAKKCDAGSLLKARKGDTTHVTRGSHIPEDQVKIPTWTVAQPPGNHTKTNTNNFTGDIHPSPAKPLTDKPVDARIGKGGTPTTVTTNYVHVTALPKQVYEYSVAYGRIISADSSKSTDDEGEERDLQRAQKKLIFDRLRTMWPFQGNHDWATDYATVWSVSPLDRHGSGEPVVGEATLTDQVDFTKFSGKPSSVTGVSLTFTRKLEFRTGTNLDPRMFLQGTNEKGASVHVVALNGLMSSMITSTANNRVISTGANRFYAANDYSDFLGVQAHRGYFSSIRPGTEHVLLNIGTMTGTFYQPILVSKFMGQLMDQPQRQISFNEYDSNIFERWIKLLRGRSVQILYKRAHHITTYDPNLDANRHRIIADLGKKPSQQMMILHGGKQKSVLQYFRDDLGAKPPPSDNWPCVNVGAKPKYIDRKKTQVDQKSLGNQIWIPAEYLVLDPDQFFGRRLASPHMEQLHRVALLRPATTQDKIVNHGFHLLGLNATNSFQALNINVTPQLLSIPARFLQDPDIVYKNQNSGQKFQPSFVRPQQASWNLRNVHFFSPATVSAHVFTLDFRTGFLGGALVGLSNDVVKALRLVGMQVPNFQPNQQLYWWTNGQKHSDSQLIQLYKNDDKHIYVVVLENTDSDQYGQIKRVFDQHVGKHTVCVTSKKLAGNRGISPQLLANLAMKYNLKCRGINHKVGENGKPAFQAISADTMVVGADVSHAPSQMNLCPSVAAVVASDEKEFAHFPGSMRLQRSKQEFLEDLQGMMMERLLRYCNNNKTLPKRIIFYRDGVGEDMYERVRDQEIKDITQAFEQLQRDSASLIKERKLHPQFIGHKEKLKLTFIVVGKRHNTRFFAQEKTQTGTNGNVKPGLIVDRVITRPAVDDTVDFFLQSHQALQGTARSAHYVILQSGGIPIDAIQKLTHAFCYNFARATKGVSYAAPAYYADRLADRGTHYLKAYTTGKKSPPINMLDSEIDTRPKSLGEIAYEKRIAEVIQRSPQWNPNLISTNPIINTRKNPWHPRMDDVMFWL